MAGSGEIVFEVRGVRVAYGAHEALSGVSLEVGEGEMLAVVGPNGSGKSTLIRTLARALRPREGVVLLDGREVGDWDARLFARRVAVVPQEGAPAFDYTVREVVEMGRAPYEGWLFPSDPGAPVAVGRAMEDVGVWDLAHRRMTELSGGERQLVALARALAQEPEVLLLDEPTNHLDVRHQLAFMRVVERLGRAGATVVLVAHDLNLAARHASRVVVMRGGEVFAAGVPSAALRPEVIREVFGAQAEVLVSPATGDLIVQSTASGRVTGGGIPEVHVICGGGSGSLLMRRLSEEGVGFSAGVLPPGDLDHAVARALGAEIVEAEPFAPIPGEVLRRNAEAARSAHLVAVCGSPPGGRVVLGAAFEALEEGIPVAVVDHHGGGDAAPADLLEAGAFEAGPEDFVRELRGGIGARGGRGEG